MKKQQTNGDTQQQTNTLPAYPTNADIVAGDAKVPDGLRSALADYVREHAPQGTKGETVMKLIDDIESDFEQGNMFGIDAVLPVPETATALRLLADGIDAAWQATFRS